MIKLEISLSNLILGELAFFVMVEPKILYTIIVLIPSGIGAFGEIIKEHKRPYKEKRTDNLSDRMDQFIFLIPKVAI